MNKLRLQQLAGITPLFETKSGIGTNIAFDQDKREKQKIFKNTKEQRAAEARAERLEFKSKYPKLYGIMDDFRNGRLNITDEQLVQVVKQNSRVLMMIAYELQNWDMVKAALAQNPEAIKWVKDKTLLQQANQYLQQTQKTI